MKRIIHALGAVAIVPHAPEPLTRRCPSIFKSDILHQLLAPTECRRLGPTTCGWKATGIRTRTLDLARRLLDASAPMTARIGWRRIGAAGTTSPEHGKADVAPCSTIIDGTLARPRRTA